MTQNNPFTDFFAQNDFSKMLENYQAMPFDMKSFLETQRKNAQALTEAQKMAFEGLQTVIQRQAEILSQMVEDNSNLAKDLMAEGSPEQKMTKNAEMFKTVYERTVQSMKEMADIMNKSGEDASNIINKRVSASMNEIKSSLEKTAKKKAA